MARVLVAGATGYLGRFVVRELKKRGHFVRALARSPEKLEDLRGQLDEVVRGEVTRTETLAGVCDGIDVVFSSVGITRQQGKQTFKDVDYQGNLNLLTEAQRAGVGKFVYVSVINGPELRHLDIVEAHEDFVEALRSAGLDYAVLRPTGYFSDMGEILKMARKGRVYLFGRGDSRINPIHGADLAGACVDGIEGGQKEIDVGGPETLTWREVASTASRAVGKPVRITSVPLWLMAAVIFVTRLFNRHTAELMAFFTTMGSRDVVGPPTGTRTLASHYRDLAADAQVQGSS